MAKRDVQLVIRARSEADRAIDSITSAMRTLLGVQDDLTGSGERTSATLESLAGAFNTVDAAFAKIERSVDGAARSLASQEAALAENEAQYTALARQVEAAEQAIVNTAMAYRQDGSDQLAAKLAAAQQAYRDLTGEAGRLQSRIASQRADVAAASDAYDGLEGAAAAAQLAIGEMGDAGEREALRTAAAAREAEQALLDQAAAARQEVAARRAQADINDQLGVRDIDTGAARASAEVFEQDARAKEEAARATEELDAAAARLRGRLDPTRAAQDRLNAEMQEARGLYNAGKINIRELTAEMNRLETEMKQVKTAQDQINRNGSNEIRGVLGLRPYELQNLSFQINDVFTQLASGTPVTQTFAQQGGQIIQIFPKLLTGALKYAKVLGPLAAAIGLVVAAMSRQISLSAQLRDFQANLALSADGARYQAEELVEATQALDNYGASLDDAKAAIDAFLAESVNPELLDEFGRAAQNLADITGVDLNDAANDVAKAFTGAYEELAEFDDKLNFLTLSEREQIRAMFDSGKESEAREMAFARFYDMAEDGARATETAWDRMLDSMSGAWTTFINYIGNTTVFQDLKKEINDVMVGATYLLNRLQGLDHNTAARDALGIERANGRGEVSSGDPLDTDSERERKRRSDAAFEEAQRRSRRSGRARGGKSQAELQADFNREIERANRNREIAAQNADRTNVLAGETLILEQRRQEIAEAIRKAEDRASRDSKRRLTLSQAQRDEIARTVGLEFDAENAKAVAQARQEEHEQRINDLVAERRELTEALDFQGPDTAGYALIERSLDSLDQELIEAREEAVAFWDAVAADDTQMALLGVNAQQVATTLRNLENEIDQARQNTLNRARQASERGMEDLRAQQALLQEQLEAAQLTGQSGRAGLIQEQLADIEVRLAEGARKAIEFWHAIQGDPEQLRLMGLTSQEVENIILGLENTIAQAELLGRQFLKTGEALNRDLASGGVNAMDQFAQSIVNGENVLSSFANAFLQFSADFLLQMARMIAQQALFNSLSGGSPGGAGGAGGFLSGLVGGLFHGGGVVAGGGRGRNVSASIFASASRYHGGGIAGLKPDEVPAILQRGEEVITRGDARHRRNGGGGNGGGKGMSQILAIGEEQIAQAMAGNAGREVFITRIRTDRATIRKELGID